MGRAHTNQRARGPQSRNCTECAADESEQQAFTQELVANPPAPSAESNADGDLAPATSGACKQQTSKVRAGNQQNETNSAEKNEQRRPNGPGKLIAERNEIHDTAVIVLRITQSEARCEGAHLRLGLLESEARIQSCDHAEEAAGFAAVMQSRYRHERSP